MSHLPLIETRDLCKLYPDGNVRALQDVNLVFQRGEYVAIMGPSGSGKSTLLSMLGALDRPTSGDVIFAGESLAQQRNLDQFRSEKVGFVFQSFYLLPTLTALENVQIPMFERKWVPSKRARRAAELLAAVDMSHRCDHLPRQLSIGERQRVAIARALANEPELVLADEPTGNLDSKTTADVLKLFQHLHETRETTLIMVTHSDDVASHAERCVRVRDGCIEHDAPRLSPTLS